MNWSKLVEVVAGLAGVFCVVVGIAVDKQIDVTSALAFFGISYAFSAKAEVWELKRTHPSSREQP